MALPGRQDELVRRVAAANPNTVVVVNSGMPVLMPWAGEVAAILQVWLPGQAFGEALADVLIGSRGAGRTAAGVDASRGGRLAGARRPPAGGRPHLRARGCWSATGATTGAGTDPLFCFGHGLGYTEWSYESIAPAADSIKADEDLDLRGDGPQLGTRAGREVVQVYLEGPDDDPQPAASASWPRFAASRRTPGEQAEVRLTVPARSFARFDEARRDWAWRRGTYTLHAGRSSRDLRLSTRGGDAMS